jgi:spermidine synthase
MILERVLTPRGELVLRRRDGALEIISNGTFLMDTRDGRSERLLVDAALARCPAPTPRVLIGGLGVGYSLARALRHEHVAEVTVVEIEPALIEWHATHLRGIAGAALDDPRVRVICADLPPWLDRQADRYDAICLDIDNGPEWTVTPDNAALYRDGGLAGLRAALSDGGVLAVWSAAPAPDFADRLAKHLGPVERLDVPVQRGVPDVVYLARRTG